MRRFRFVGDARFYEWDEKPVYGKIYNGDFCWTWGGKNGDPLETWYSIMRQDWQEVFDEPMITDGPVTFTQVPKTLHKDTDLGWFTMQIVSSLLTTTPFVKQTAESSNEKFVSQCIELAKELIKQLDSSNNPASD